MTPTIEAYTTVLFQSLNAHLDAALGLGPALKCQGMCAIHSDRLDQAFQGAMLAAEKREDVSA